MTPEEPNKADELEAKIDYHLKQKKALQSELTTLHRRIHYREEQIRKLAAQRTIELNLTLPLS